eukprot:5129162-Pyramimonas_sp.AAC.1
MVTAPDCPSTLGDMHWASSRCSTTAGYSSLRPPEPMLPRVSCHKMPQYLTSHVHVTWKRRGPLPPPLLVGRPPGGKSCL